MLCAGGARSYLGVDISAEAVQIAEARYKVSENISFMLATRAVSMALVMRLIDVAVSFETIEHLPDPQQFLARIRDALVSAAR